ncbi:MAG: cyclic nucleotide-binding domain-containing protein [Acidobacteriota bacterium]
MSIDTERFTKVPLFEKLNPDEVASLLEIAEDVLPEAGDVVVEEGSDGDAFYVISDGVFDVVQGGSSALEQKVMARLEEYSFFGEMALVSADKRSASVHCVKEGRLKRFPLDAFQAKLDDGDLAAYKVTHAMARILAQRLNRVQKRFITEFLALTAGHVC